MKKEAISYLNKDGERPALAIFPLKGKIPLTDHGCKDATRDRAQVEAWWKKYPSANIGIATGEINHLLVIDIDQKPDQGKPWFQQNRRMMRHLHLYRLRRMVPPSFRQPPRWIPWSCHQRLHSADRLPYSPPQKRNRSAMTDCPVMTQAW